mmetsp:Transcript_43179/g.119431  ORF Transcript_43179/g.119431 Transcript_43179/m.119431 type:complete len:229 (+) Transcript_43179:55-741(+)
MSNHHPSALRNRDPILSKLRELLPQDLSGRALEVASGTGAHLEVFAPAFPLIEWQPSEYCPDVADDVGKIGDRGGLAELAALDAAGCKVFSNVRPALAVDASLAFDAWPDDLMRARGTFTLVYASNVTHISPYEVTLGLLAGAAELLAENGTLIIYGPFKVDGECTTESNAQFDASLRSRNPRWGYRDVGDLREVALKLGLVLQGRHDMPANNFLLHFVKSVPPHARS